MPTLRESFTRLVSALDDSIVGPRRIEKERSLFEMLVVCYWERVGSAKQAGAILNALGELELLSPSGLAELDVSTLADLLRQERLSVSPKQIAPFLRLVRRLVVEQGIDLEGAVNDVAESTSTLREGLLSIAGIGPATADDILLRVFGRARYPLDRATYRILIRHGWIDSTADYDEAAGLLIECADGDTNLLRILSLWFEDLGRSHCRAGGPKCERCPLRPLLPEQGPVEGDA